MTKPTDPSARSSPDIRSLARGLGILRLLGQAPSHGFLDLQRASGLPKATLARVLQTLEHEGWASRRLVDGQYRLSGKAPKPDAMNAARARLSELAMEPLRQMHRKILWPSDISICDGTKMVILESNRTNGPLSINRQVMGLYPRMLWSAAGRAYMATCPPQERARILANLAASTHKEDAQVADGVWLRGILRETRKQGYGLRAAGYASPDQQFPGQLGALAVPICAQERVVAALSLVWVLSMVTQVQVVAAHEKLLRATANEIGAAFARDGFAKPLWLDRRFARSSDASVDALGLI